MNFEFFDLLYANAQFDEIKVIGKEIQKEEQFYHIIGMTRKEKEAVLYVLELANCLENERFFAEKTPRESLKQTMEEQRNGSFFMHIRELYMQGKTYETAGASSGPIKNSDYCEAFLLFLKMREAGWEISEDSLFYTMGWDSFVLTRIELRDEFDSLPNWEDTVEVLINTAPESYAIEQAVQLECGGTPELTFLLNDGTTAHCYINKIYPMDVWAEEEKRFSDPVYREKMLQHISEEELEQMKRHLFEVLEEQCPRGCCYMVVEYECTEEISLNFYDSVYLDTVEKPKGGSASALFMRVKPDEKTGMHGLPLCGCVIQTPIGAEVKALQAELFSYSKRIEKRIEQL